MEYIPDGKRSIRLLAMEIDVKFLQYTNGSPKICAMELLSKSMAVKVGVSDGFKPLHNTLKLEKKIR